VLGFAVDFAPNGSSGLSRLLFVAAVVWTFCEVLLDPRIRRLSQNVRLGVIACTGLVLALGLWLAWDYTSKPSPTPLEMSFDLPENVQWKVINCPNCKEVGYWLYFREGSWGLVLANARA
jgi:hypothetical protein